ncbi:MAG TPA: quinone-dependent dihydroorotate dehydrogenase [Verrucomicrobiae bacterium]|nr:quinone-dependent dihydroorotate dehydrogenase [Verrucomicrobiae bacterium]
MLYQTFLRPWLFQADPEIAHEHTLRLAGWLGRWHVGREAAETLFVLDDRRLRQTVFGVEFPNPVGLGAGYDKNAVGLALWPSLGFGFVEVGSVTARAQPGNQAPRLFRQPKQRALVNRLGFNNEGAVAIAARVPQRPHRIPIGVNVGKNRDVDLARAGENYRATIEAFRGRADFFVINISSPNTPGLRELQNRGMLDALLAEIREETPVLLKIAPDLTFEEIDGIVESALKHGVAGIVATNTTVDHPTPSQGGLSGAPLRARSTKCVRHVWHQTQGRLPIIGVGGIFTAEDAYEKIRAGACLVEVWTGLVYEGPAIVRRINSGLLRLLDRDGFSHIAEAVGTE